MKTTSGMQVQKSNEDAVSDLLPHKTSMSQSFPTSAEVACLGSALAVSKTLQGLIEHLESEKAVAEATAKASKERESQLKLQLASAWSYRVETQQKLDSVKAAAADASSRYAGNLLTAMKAREGFDFEVRALRAERDAFKTQLSTGETKWERNLRQAVSEAQQKAQATMATMREQHKQTDQEKRELKAKLDSATILTTRTMKIVKAAEHLVINNSRRNWLEHGRRMNALAEAVKFGEDYESDF
ncbi:hypothetical protein TI39_contig303g00021 [Zymoseptoria brevis]|uniref:Uncharacterized protein n=1 Tax=Zymoseptoria brevis TaxID=1047168 RepID=A0A0F4GUJ6_9PEZI|nr:hypothetical protein TI39_contig303g00021 [Zymoseptoria brevis]